MKKFDLLDIIFVSVCSLAGGYLFYHHFIQKKPQPQLIATSKGTVIGTEIIPPVEKELTKEERIALFEQARGYRGGAAPPAIVLQTANALADEAKATILKLGLTAEFEAYLASQANAPQPM